MDLPAGGAAGAAGGGGLCGGRVAGIWLGCRPVDGSRGVDCGGVPARFLRVLDAPVPPLAHLDSPHDNILDQLKLQTKQQKQFF